MRQGKGRCVTDSVLLQDLSSGVLTLTLNRADKMNALSRAMVDALRAALIDSMSNNEVRIIVIKGAGRAFCAGADLKERATMSEAETRAFVAKLRDSMNLIYSHPKITLAHITGFALGGGLEMALACDLRYAVKGVKVGLTETGLGIIPGAGGTQLLPRIAGVSAAKRLIFKAKPILAEEAQQLGIVDVCDEADALAETLQADADAMAANAPLALQAAKMAINNGAELGLQQGLAIERLCYDRIIPTEDRLEGLRAFKEKRKPKYQGR